MTKIYITRHGQTEWNVEKRFQGHRDSNLTELGVKQAKWLGESLRDVEFDVILSSPAGRTMSTANYIRGHRKIAIIPDPNFYEINLGSWEGVKASDIKEKCPEELYHFWERPDLFQSSNGENFKDLVERVGKGIEGVIEEYQGKAILIVTHAAALKAIITYIEGKELKDLWRGAFMHPTCLNILEVDKNGRRFTLQGDISHYLE